MNTKPLTCRQAQQLLQKEVEFDNPLDRALKSHLSHCEQCRNLAYEIDATLNLATKLAQPELDPFFVTRFEARLYAEQQKFTKHWVRSIVQPALATAALLLAIIGGVLLGGVINNQLPANNEHASSQQFASDYNLVDEPTDNLLQLLDDPNN